MSRQLKRVPLDYAWPLKKAWEGFLNPHYEQCSKCAACDGSGYGPHAKRFQDEWYGYVDFDPKAYGATPLTVDHPAVQDAARRNVERSPDYYGGGPRAIAREAQRLFELWRYQWSHHLVQADVDALIANGRLWDFTRNGKPSPTADEVNDWSLRGMAHDAINSGVCVEARCKRERVPRLCKQCKGSGERWTSLEAKKAADKWKKIEPPKGEGFQLWEDCSEGSPVSPVFATLDELCAWCETGATTFGSNKTSAAEWKRMLEADFVVHKEGNAIFM